MHQPSRRLSETALRGALLARLHASLGDQEVLVEELAIEHGAARIDVAVAGDALFGYEIKSDFDTLDRLARQMHAYHRVFDRLTVVTTRAFAEPVIALLPAWWGVLLAEPDGICDVRFVLHRQPTPHARQDARSIASLLWRDEAFAFVLEEVARPVKARATRDDLYDLLAQQVPLQTIQKRVLTKLKAREASRRQAAATYTLPEAIWRTV